MAFCLSLARQNVLARRALSLHLVPVCALGVSCLGLCLCSVSSSGLVLSQRYPCSSLCFPVNLCPIQWETRATAVGAGGRLSIESKVGSKHGRREARPGARSLQSASLQGIAVAEKSGLVAGWTGTMHESPAQSQRKTAQIGATWRAQSTIHCSSCKGLVRLAYIYSACPELCWVTQASKV